MMGASGLRHPPTLHPVEAPYSLTLDSGLPVLGLPLWL